MLQAIGSEALELFHGSLDFLNFCAPRFRAENEQHRKDKGLPFSRKHYERKNRNQGESLNLRLPPAGLRRADPTNIEVLAVVRWLSAPV